jgi:hypothetical protein
MCVAAWREFASLASSFFFLLLASSRTVAETLGTYAIFFIGRKLLESPTKSVDYDPLLAHATPHFYRELSEVTEGVLQRMKR